MRFKQIVENSTTAGSVATVAMPLMTQTRESVDVPGLKPVQQVMKGKAKKKGPYANSIVEGRVKEITKDLKDLTSHQFQEKYKQSKADVRADMKKVNEDDLSEQDLIVVPGQGRLKRTGFVPNDSKGNILDKDLSSIDPDDQGEEEGSFVKNQIHTMLRVLKHLENAIGDKEDLPEWVQMKLSQAQQSVVGVMDYMISDKEREVERHTGHDSLMKENNNQRVDSIVTDALKRMKGPDVSDAVLALKRVLGDRAYNERRGFYSFYVDQIHKMYNQQGVTEVAYRADLPKDQGRYTNDTTPSIGGVSMNRIKVGDIVNYFGEKVEVLDLGNGQARVTGGGKTMNVPLSKLKQYGQGMKEGVDAAWDTAKKKVAEGAKVDRMVQHVKQSEKKLGHSDKEAENIAWATANKRGMLDNKNKKK